MLHFIFNLNEISHSETNRCFLNVIENPHQIKKKRYLERRDVPVAHVLNDASKTAEKLVNVDHIETGSYIFEDSFKVFNYASKNQYIKNSNNTTWHHSNLLVTGLFNESEEPLWYGHRVSLSATEIEIISESMVYPKSRYRIVEEINYLQSSTYQVVAHNVDHIDQLYFLKYKLNNRIYLELLNRERLYHRSFDFIDNYWSPPNKKMLLYKVIKEQSRLRIALPEDTPRLAIKEQEYSVSAKIPPYQFGNEPWYIEVPLVEFYSTRHFDLPEYASQYFDHGKPFKQITNDVGLVEGSHLLRISHQEIQLENIEVALYEANSSKPVLLLTNNPSLVGTKNLDYNLEWTLDNLSVSALDNLIYLQQDVSRYSFAKVSYKIRSYSYLDERLNLNPFLNTSLKDKQVVFYLHHQYGLLYFVLDSQNFVLEASHALYETWVGKQYEVVPPNTNSGLSFYFYLGNLLKTNLESDKAILLARVRQPKCLEEFDGMIHSVKRIDLPSLEEAYFEKPHLLPRTDNELFENIWSVPELKNTEIVNVHWEKLKDYVNTNLISKKMLYEAMRKRMPIGIQTLIVEDGVPLIEIGEVDLANNKVEIKWIPPLQLNHVLEGTVYTSSDGISFTAIGTISNLVFTRNYWVTLSSETLYVRLKPRITIGSDIYFGPVTNTVCISKKVI